MLREDHFPELGQPLGGPFFLSVGNCPPPPQKQGPRQGACQRDVSCADVRREMLLSLVMKSALPIRGVTGAEGRQTD